MYPQGIFRDSSAIRRLFSRLVGVVGRQRALHTKNSGFAHTTLPWHISTFRGYRILFSIRNPYVHRFTYFFGYVPLVVNTSRSFPHSRLITGFLTRLTRRVPLVEQELLTLQEHMSSPPVFSGVRVTQSLVLYVCFVDHYLPFCTFSFGYCDIYSSTDSDYHL